MKVDISHELFQDGGVAIQAGNVKAVLTAPEGFSFAEYERVNQYMISAGTLDSGNSYTVCVPIYPIYAAQMPSDLNFTSTPPSDIHETEDRPIQTLPVRKNPPCWRDRAGGYESER